MDKKTLLNQIIEYNFLNPIITFPDEYAICSTEMDDLLYDPKKDILLLNSKIENGINLYEKLQKKYAYTDMDESLSSSSWYFPLLLSKVNEDGKGRHLEFSYIYTCTNLIEDSKYLKNIPNGSIELLNYTKQILREKRNKFKDFLNNKEESEFYEEIKEQFDFINLPITTKTVESYIDLYTKIIVQFRYMVEVLEKRKNYVSDEELYQCFEPDTLALIICKSIVELCKHSLNNGDMLNQNYSLVIELCDMVKQANIKDYNHSIKYYDYKNKRYERYSIKDLQKDADFIESKATGAKKYQLDAETIEKLGLMQDSEAFAKFSSVFFDENSKERFIANWDIIAPGARNYSQQSSKDDRKKDNDNPIPKTEIDNVEIMRRRMILENTNYICQIVGKNKFAGYIGFIFGNGVVIFEKFYEDNAMQKTIKNSNATYKMNIKNFVEFTQKSKQEIIEFIKDTKTTEIERIYHSKNWENKILRFIAEINYDETVKATIEQLLAKQEVSKLNKK